MISPSRSATVRSAGADGTRDSTPSRRTRTCGYSSRSSVRSVGGRCTALAQTSPRLEGCAGSPRTRATRPSRTSTSRPQPTPQYGHSVADSGMDGLRLEEAEHLVAQPEVIRPRQDLFAHPRARELHAQDLAD